MKKNTLLEFRRLREALTAERATISQRLAAISEALGEAHVAPSGPLPASFGTEAPVRPGPRGMSAAARRKIGRAQRERWARQGEAARVLNTRGSKKSGARHMSPAQRAKISETMKKRWALRKAGK